MKANYGDNAQYEYSTIAGYLIRVGLKAGPGVGIQERLSVYILLHDQIDTALKDLPSQDSRLADGVDNPKKPGEKKPWTEELKITLGEQVAYSFPLIRFDSINSYFTNSLQFHLLHFAYSTPGLTPGQGKEAEIPEIKITNKVPPEYKGDQIRCKGSIALNKEGANAAPLLGIQSKQQNNTASGIQVISERCSHAQGQKEDTGWLNKLLAQGKLCNNGGNIDLAFSLNGKVYNCAPGDSSEGAALIYFEERWGLALDLPLPSLHDLSDNAWAWRPVQVESMISRFTGFNVLEDTDTATPVSKKHNRAIEICSVISTTASARRFDWRTSRQMPSA